MHRRGDIKTRALQAPASSLGEADTILPMCFSRMDTEAVRWDPRFLRPLNHEAVEAFSKAAGSIELQESMVRIQLSSPGDTLLIDNWRCLHGGERDRSGGAQQTP